MEYVCCHSQNSPFTRSNKPQRRASWSTWRKRPIYKDKRTTGQSMAFYGDPEFRCYFTKNLHGPPLRPSLCSQLVYTSMTFHGDTEFRRHFFQKFTWTSIKTLAMEPIGLHGQNGPFIRSNESRSRYGARLSPQPKRLIYNVKRSKEQSTRFYGDPEF
ncbi:hypothetical protein H5410_049325 [Solanum commersonii]|uniref:Uncharacterized protein n=1 Tax=Solanum commersonii TaxID=4109 RepID=A0A9J5WSM4_SOLCO|nr:hypothetical protein H5410_049325 [Solanum commersonii]